MAEMKTKRANAVDEYTPEQIQELAKCQRDPIYFLEKYCKVKHPTRGPVPFEMYDYQKEMLLHIHENKDTIFLASRQLGKCVTADTKVTICKKPRGFRKFILRFLEPDLYAALKD